MTGLLDVPRFTGPALCAEVDVGDLFFPDKGGSTKDAKRVCGMCDVRAECLQWALDRDERHGVWGGLSDRERRRLRLHPVPAAPLRQGGWRWTDEAAWARVADLTGRGWTVEEIAADLDVSVRTVYRITARQRSGRGAA